MIRKLTSKNPNKGLLGITSFSFKIHSFSQPLTKWDTSKVSNMNNMFDESQAFKNTYNRAEYVSKEEELINLKNNSPQFDELKSTRKSKI